MKRFAVPRMTFPLLLADKLMVPVMIVLRGFRLDSLQETHAWHPYRHIDPKDIDLRMAVAARGTDGTVYKGRYSFLFHAPIFGGWKRYSVYEVAQADVPFHIGWIVDDAHTGKHIETAIQRLPIQDTCIRMLDGPPNYQGYFFAVNAEGLQVPLRVIGHGTLGDGKYRAVRLF